MSTPGVTPLGKIMKDKGRHSDYEQFDYGVLKEKGLPQGISKLDDSFKGPQNIDPSKLDYSDSSYITTSQPCRYDANGNATGVEGETTECLIRGSIKRIIASTPGIGSPPPRPPSIKYRIVDTHNKGLGVFATEDIAAGELILAERPIMIVPANMPSLRGKELAGMSSSQVKQVELADSEVIAASAVDRLQPHRKEAFFKLANSHLHDGSGPIIGRIRTNGFGQDWVGKSDVQDMYCIVCDEGSRLNHSCSPNSQQKFDVRTFSMQFRAVRPIKKGEEITYSYCDVHEVASVRAQKLVRYDVVCDCKACANPTTSDPNRLKAQEWIQRMKSCRFADFSLPTSTTVSLLLTGLRLFESEGLESMLTFGQILFTLMKTYAAKGDVENTQVYARRYNKWLLASMGDCFEEDDVENAFGLVASARLVQGMKGMWTSGGARKAKKAGKS
ncbi:hypothetical protein BXZ70DRAFT_1009669 [Cristinia sonorae]|uniref:SET domain-containing protein n=1 Tax=Cristinia sonorae TaxID=1940300 RepID=A0A8K0UL04_9AGAR|nr:hypothetical protein BXZ70DRAFT_1009669 [Cristinia sonorae]